MSLSKAPLTIVMKRVDVYCDGGARGNPGPAALGVVVHQGNLTKEYAQCLGRATNNEAEYQAAIFCFEENQADSWEKGNQSNNGKSLFRF